MQSLKIYTDGACSYNPGPGGWAAVFILGDNIKEISGSQKMTTNNRMELTAVIEALSRLKRPVEVKVYSDSAYIVNCIHQKWYANWRKNGWHNSKGQPVENKDLWEKLLELISIHKVEFIKVKGHASDKMNNRCDKLAREAAKRNG